MRLLNCEYGARLSMPDLLREEIQPIGRGTTHDCRWSEHEIESLFCE